jgi:hypothetical protein
VGVPATEDHPPLAPDTTESPSFARSARNARSRSALLGRRASRPARTRAWASGFSFNINGLSLRFGRSALQMPVRRRVARLHDNHRSHLCRHRVAYPRNDIEFEYTAANGRTLATISRIDGCFCLDDGHLRRESVPPSFTQTGSGRSNGAPSRNPLRTELCVLRCKFRDGTMMSAPGTERASAAAERATKFAGEAETLERITCKAARPRRRPLRSSTPRCWRRTPLR